MPNMTVCQLAEDLDVPIQQLLETLREWGVNAKDGSTILRKECVEMIRARLTSKKVKKNQEPDQPMGPASRISKSTSFVESKAAAPVISKKERRRIHAALSEACGIGAEPKDLSMVAERLKASGIDFRDYGFQKMKPFAESLSFVRMTTKKGGAPAIVVLPLDAEGGSGKKAVESKAAAPVISKCIWQSKCRHFGLSKIDTLAK